MIYKLVNFSRSNIDRLEAENGDVFIACNFNQSVPHTEILSGVSGLSFLNCNLMNCDIPVDSTIEKCLTVHKSLCSHINPKRLASGEITECEENCEHVVDIDTVSIDSSTITIYHYKDKVV